MRGHRPHVGTTIVMSGVSADAPGPGLQICVYPRPTSVGNFRVEQAEVRDGA
jgi:hypothetical protein